MNRQEGRILVPKQGLTPAEFAEIEALAQVCEQQDGGRLKIVWEMMRERPRTETNDFCSYADGDLSGYLGLDANGFQVEITGMVHPRARRQGTGRALVAAAVAECRRRRATRLLLVCLRDVVTGAPFAAAIGARFTESEYRMVLDTTAGIPSFDGPVQLRQARPEDAALLARLHGESFGYDDLTARDYVDRVLAERGSRVFIATVSNGPPGGAPSDSQPIGEIGVVAEDGAAYLRGFGVVLGHRGRGHGRQILSMTVAMLAKEGFTHQMLDVQTENANALALYQSCGFRQTNCYDYYEIALG